MSLKSQYNVDMLDDAWRNSFYLSTVGFLEDATLGGVKYCSEGRNGAMLYIESEVFDSAVWTMDFSCEQMNVENTYMRYYLAAEDINYVNTRAIYLECVSHDMRLRLCEQDAEGDTKEILSLQLLGDFSALQRLFVEATRSKTGDWSLSVKSQDGHTIEEKGQSDAVIKAKYSGVRVVMSQSNASLLVLHFMSAKGATYTPDKPSDPDTTQLSNVALHSLVFTEIMSDPSPTAGLPEAEYVEIYNRSDKSVELGGCKLFVGDNYGVLYPYVLEPKSYALLCSDKDILTWIDYENLLPIESFQPLINDGRMMRLESADGQLFTWLDYSKSWYGDEKYKAEGGFSLERIDVENLNVSQANFLPSRAARGGTPGLRNSVAGDNRDEVLPKIVDARMMSDIVIRLEFNKEMRFEEARFSSPDCEIESLEIDYPERKVVTFRYDTDADTMLRLQIDNLRCVSGYEVADTLIEVHALRDARKGDIVISEIMYDAAEGQVAYLELYNRSQKHIDLASVYVEKYDENGVLDGREVLESVSLSPDNYALLSSEGGEIVDMYDVCASASVATLDAGMLSRDGGVVVVGSLLDATLDSVPYGDDLHNPWVDDTEGVALERIDMKESDFFASNWTSAASVADYATPGCPNSHRPVGDLPENDTRKMFYLEYESFTPNNDAWQDVLPIHYQLPKEGYLCTIKVFSPSGEYVSTFVDSQLLASEGTFIWRGEDMFGEILPIGIYVLVVEAIHEDGSRFMQKVVAVVAA